MAGRTDTKFPRTGIDRKNFGRRPMVGLPDWMNGLRGPGRYRGNNSVRNQNSRLEEMETGESMFIYISIVSTLIFIAEVITIIALRKCKKTPLPIKYFSVNFLASQAMFQITGSVFSVIKFTDFVFTNVIVHKVAYQFVSGLTLSMSWASINVLAFDRFLASTIPLRYKLITTRFRVLLIIACVWGFNTFACSASFVWFVVDCGGVQPICSHSQPIKASLIQKQFITLAILLIVYETLNVIAFVCLRRVLREHLQYRTQVIPVHAAIKATLVKKATSVQRLILSLTVLQMVLQLPYLAELFLLATDVGSRRDPWREYLKLFSACLLRVSAIGSIYLYSWRLPECKLVFLSMFCQRNSRYVGTIRTLCRDVYKTAVPVRSRLNTPSTTSTGGVSLNSN